METTTTVDPAAMEAAAQAGAAIGGVFALIGLALGIFFVICYWKIFTKAGQPGFASIVPIWNAIVFLQIAGKPGWWFLLLCIPFVNLIVAIIATVAFAQSFGKGTGFAIGLLFLSPIFVPMLAFGSAQYGGGIAVEAPAE